MDNHFLLKKLLKFYCTSSEKPELLKFDLLKTPEDPMETLMIT